MSLRLVIDVNLSPEWVPFLTEAGIHAYHWRQVGNPSATVEPGRSRVRILPL
jgi:predicted nuclease of predicted toxin-antitoxin system